MTGSGSFPYRLATRRQSSHVLAFSRYTPAGVATLVLVAVGIERIVLGIGRHAPVVVVLGVLALAVAGFLMRRTVRPMPEGYAPPE